MPSSAKYKRERKKHYAQERRTKIAREATPSDPKATKSTSQRNAARSKLGLKVGDPRQAGHVKGKLAKKGGKTGGAVKVQSAKSNMSAGGKSGNKAGKAAGGRKGRGRQVAKPRRATSPRPRK